MRLDPETIAAINLITRRYVVWWAYGLAILEVVLVALRYRFGTDIKLVSHIVRDLSFYGLASFAYFLGGMTAHWVITWERLPWQGITAHILGVLFWAVFIAYWLADVFDPNYKYWPLITQWLRYPPVVALIGALLAFFCFPQRSRWFPGDF